MFALFRIARAERAKIFRRLVRFTRQVRADDGPTAPLISGLEQDVRGKVQRLGIERRKRNRQRAVVAIFAAPYGLRRNVRRFAERLIRARNPSAVKNVGVHGVNSDSAVFLHAGEAPIAVANLAVVAAASSGDAATFLLPAVDPVGKAIVRGDVIKLRGWLVVPSAPGGAAIHADRRSLIGAQRHDLRILRTDPDVLVIVTARRALEADKRFPPIRGLPGGRVGHIDHVGIVWRNGNTHSARPAPADAVIGIHQLKALSRILRAINSRAFVFRFDGQVHDLGIAGSNRNADARQAVFAAGQALCERLPRRAAIGGFVESAAWNDERFTAANFHGATRAAHSAA